MSAPADEGTPTMEPTAVEGDTPDVERRLLAPSEVARMFHVDARTVARWETQRKLSAVRTLGGHRRYRVAEVVGLLEQRAET